MRKLLALLVAALAAGCTESDSTSDSGTETSDPETPPANVTAPAWGGLEAPIRPGASFGGFCTFNFLFVDNVTQEVYIGTAGHCTDSINQSAELPGVGPIGNVVYDSDITPGADPAVDFSLIYLDQSLIGQANPEMLGHGGPNGVIDAADLAAGDLVGVHGYGLVLGENDYTRTRQGALTDWDAKLYRADMPAVNGDSGSPLLHIASGKALGIISHYGLGATPPTTDEGPLMTFILEQLHAAGFSVDLATV